MTPAVLRSPHGRVVALVIVLLASPAARLSGQATTVSTSGGTLRVHAPAFAFIEGSLLDRLRDGRSVQIDLELTILAQPGGQMVAKAGQRFNLSFDLWEERFAVSKVGSPPRSVSHLTSRNAEAWCLDNLMVPLSELSRLSRDTPFWVRVEYRVENQHPESEMDPETGTLQRLIEMLSRRRQDSELRKSLEAGPFRLSG